MISWIRKIFLGYSLLSGSMIIQCWWIKRFCKVHMSEGILSYAVDNLYRVFLIEVRFKPSQPIRVMSSVASLPNHTFPGHALSSEQMTEYLCTLFYQKLTTALLESAEGREWPQKIFHDQSQQKIVARPYGDPTCDLLITSWTGIWLNHQGWLIQGYHSYPISSIGTDRLERTV